MVKENVEAWLEEHEAEVIQWRRKLHSNPELSHQETQTTRFIASVLREHGLDPQYLPKTGLIVDIGQAPFIGIRGDIDAIPIQEKSGVDFSSITPNVMHGCGHDAHTAIVMGLACAVAEYVQTHSLPMGVRFIFQPAEEVMDGGALEVIEAGGLDGVEEIYALHCEPKIPVGTIGLKSGAITSAADIVEITLTGPGGHTSRPHRSADVVFALGELITQLPAILSRRVDPRTGTVLTFGSVHSGSTFNAIPQEGTLVGTLRTGRLEVWQEAEPLMRELIDALIRPLGVKAEVNYIKGVPPVINSEEQTARLAAYLAGQSVVDVPQSSGGEDFSWYLRQVPGLMVRLGTWNPELAMGDLHQADLVIDERAIAQGILFFSSVLDAYMQI